jgi:histidinol-phosphate aminotransferase
MERAMTATALKYVETERGCDLDLSDNTNLWGAPPSVARVLREIKPTDLSRYPSAYSDRLKKSIAKYAGVDESMIVTGCGSDDVLDSAIRGFGIPGDLLAMQNPSFSMIPVFATVSGLLVKGISRDCGDLARAMCGANARINYLCSPNNPTGEVISPDTIEAIVSDAKGIVIVDEAYIEFGGASCTGLLERFDNLLVTRTFSKALGLAGFRLGYGLASPAMVARIEAARGPYKVSALSEIVGAAVIDNDLQWVTEKASEAVVNRERFAAALKGIGLEPMASGANFLLIPVRNSREIEARLRAQSIAVRAFEGLSGIGDALRVTVGPWPMMERFIDTLAEIVR